MRVHSVSLNGSVTTDVITAGDLVELHWPEPFDCWKSHFGLPERRWSTQVVAKPEGAVWVLEEGMH